MATTTQTETQQIGDVAKALELVLHMITVLADGGQPAREDVGEVAELIARINYPQRT